MSSNSELTVLPNVFSWLTDNYGEYSLYIQNHRYGAGYCAAIVPTELVPVIDNLTTGGDSYVPYVFSSYIDSCGAKGLPVAYGESANAAVFELESQLDSFGEAENDHYRLEKWHPAFELFLFLDSIKDKDHYEDYIRGWPVLKKGGPRPLQAQALLNALGNPDGWLAAGDSVHGDRELTVGHHTWYLRTVVRCAEVTVDSAKFVMEASVRFADEQLVQQAKRDGTDIDAHELIAMCRFFYSGKVAA